MADRAARAAFVRRLPRSGHPRQTPSWRFRWLLEEAARVRGLSWPGAACRLSPVQEDAAFLMAVRTIPWRTISIVAVAVLMAACSRDTTRFGPPPGAGPVAAAPTPRVMTQPLPPPGERMEERANGDEPQVAALPPPTASPTRENVLGQWSLSAPGDACQLFVTLTTWEGGYRASTRGCASPELTSVGAWNIEGDLVVLKDGEGNPLARLAMSGPTRFDGRLELGGAVTMSR